MDGETRNKLRTGATKPLNLPEALQVEEDRAGMPVAVRLKRRHTVLTVEDCWRIDDEWWRSEPVSRLYYTVVLDSGRRMILCHNLIDRHWFSQSY